MKSKTIYTFVILIGIIFYIANGNALQLGLSLPVTCGVDEYQTPSGCWSSCSSSKYNTCGDFFPLLYNPSFCAYTADGKYVSYTFECQACKSTEVVAVRSGACDCSFLKCGVNQQCLDGQCVDKVPIDVIAIDPIITCPEPCLFGRKCIDGQCVLDLNLISPIDKCATIRCASGYACYNGRCVIQPNILDLCLFKLCPFGTVCQNGNCIQQVNSCLTVKCSAGYVCKGGQCVLDPLQQQICQARRVKCGYPRPNELTCPTRYYFAAPAPKVCGISSLGKEVNFPEECDACKDTSIQYYWTKPCDQIKPCASIKSIVTPITVDPCANVVCIGTQTCLGGRCVGSFDQFI